jgi:ribosomal protein S18 acetylase RimI-like enzyme
MQIKSYNRTELEEYVHSDFFRTLNKIPISIQRAISQINNPYCSSEDILLWAAYENASLIGYIGVLPDTIELKNSKNKIYWVSCFWVSEAYRNENLASQLFFLLIKQYKSQLFISNFLFSLENTYQGLGIFQPTQYNFGRTFYINFCFSDILQARFPELIPVMPFYLIAEKLLNLILKTRRIFNINKKKYLNIIENKELDEELWSFLNTFSLTSESVVRSVEHFRWILNFPWVLTGKPDKESGRYYFTSKSEQFEYKLLKLYDSQKLAGFVLLKIRDKNLTVSYLYSDNDHIESIVYYLLKLSFTENINTITTFDQRLSKKLKKKRQKFIFIKNIKRPYIFPKNYEIESSIFQDGDGDLIFT